MRAHNLPSQAEERCTSRLRTMVPDKVNWKIEIRMKTMTNDDDDDEARVQIL